MVLRALLAVLLLAAAAPARAEPKPDPLNWLGGPLAPHFFANDMDDRGLPRYPFDPADDIKNGAGYQLWTRASRHFTEGSRQGTRVQAGLRLEDRLGGFFEWSQYGSGAFKSERRSDLVTLHATADLSRSDDLTLEYGFGMTVLWADRTFAGPSAALSVERRLCRPLTLYARYSPAILTHTSPLHDLTGGLGANWRWLGVEAGYRALLNGLRHVYGPEAALRVWL